MKIEDKILTEENQYDPVTYVPNHVNGNAGHKDCEPGVIIRFDDQFVFVLYSANRLIQATKPDNLVWG